jgi:hypothetical protein
MPQEEINEVQSINIGESSIPVHMTHVGVEVGTMVFASLFKYGGKMIAVGITGIVVGCQETRLQIRLLKKHNQLQCEISMLEDLAFQLDKAYERAKTRIYSDPSGRERHMARLAGLERMFAAHLEARLSAALN